MEMVKLLARYCDDLIEAGSFSNETIPQVARKNGHPDIALFLENEQKARYERLRIAGEKQANACNLNRVPKVRENMNILFSGSTNKQEADIDIDLDPSFMPQEFHL